MPEQQRPPERCRLHITGIVQGIGFRPFLYRLATRHSLVGFVRNDDRGVELEVEGEAAAVTAFVAALRPEAPPLARITAVEASVVPALGRETAFAIEHSLATGAARATLISPDVAVCEACLAEMRDPADRRYRYPFINCTDCGPRYTIIAGTPYDRPLTTMRRFALCAACRAEYDDPSSRRFHAQPNACPSCGPHLTLLDVAGQPLATGAGDIDLVTTVARTLASGAIVAVKGLGGFHLACDATRAEVVARLRQRKQRDEKPFAVMIADLAAAERLAEISPAERRLLASTERPIVLLARRAGALLADQVAPQSRRLGLLLPYTPLHHLLLAEVGLAMPLVMTSANPSDEPIVRDNDEALHRLCGIADFFLLHDRDILCRGDDSVVQHTAGATRLIRRSRGFVPLPFSLPFPAALAGGAPSVLAVGGELKATICLTRGGEAFLSQHLGDLENAPTFAFFEETIAHLCRVLSITPQVIAHDLHPEYLSTRYALGRGDLAATAIGVQHHHAHILACLAEHPEALAKPVIGLAMDGTGYGPDQTLWGGEVLLVDGGHYQRAAHLLAMPLPGGERAIREPWRMALACLHHLGEAARLPFFLSRWPHAAPETARALLSLLEGGSPFVRSSGLGRLFDAVAGLLGLRDRVAFEGQAAMELEQAASPSELEDAEPYPFAWTAPASDAPLILDPAPILRGLLADLDAGAAAGAVATRFHTTLAGAMTDVCCRLRSRLGISMVAMGGGVFQNRLLLGATARRLEVEGFSVLLPSQVPANDGGIALGQAVAALCRLAAAR